MNNNYENKILDAIQTLVDTAVSKAGYDKTIKAVISKCVNQNTGKYVVKYQDSSFYAYSNDLDSVYSGGTPVYVLVPGNDMSQTKTILGSVDKLGTEYINLSESSSAYQEVGTSIVTPNGTIPGISSYKSGGDSLVIYDRTASSGNTVNVDTEGAEIYFQNAQYIEIGGTFTTRLNEEQKRRGNYGLVFDISFKDGEEEVHKNYVIDINSMTGNPYSYNYGSAQTAIFQIDGANFYRLNSITLECKNFPHSVTPANADIFVEDIVLKALTPLTRDEIANNSLTFITKQGIYFNADDSADATRLIETEVKINKKVVPNTGGLLRFYWFKEDSTVGITSPDYLPFGGPGWKCINTYNVIDEINDIRDYITDVDTLTVIKSGNPAKENEYKCVVIYNDEIQVERNIIIYNQASEYTITIESDQGNYFKYNEGNPTLTCSVNPTGTYTYIWTETNSANRTEVLAETSNMYSVQLSNIANFSKFTCSVYSSGNFVGKSDIVITNSWDSEDNSYALVMENSDQIFKYNEKGIAPTNKSLEKPIVLKPLQFTLYDEMGHQVDDNKILSTDVFWYVPKEDTMIKVSDAGITPTEEDGYLVYNGLKTLNFTIASIYNIKKLNNTIKLVVRYNDRVLNTVSELEFIKEGEIGSNGTDFVCRIVPNVASGGAVPTYPIFTANMSTNPVVGDMNYNRPSGQSDKWFKVQLYKDGVQIYEGVASGTSEENKSVTIEWSMLKNKYTSSVIDSSSFTVDSSTGAFTYVDLDDDLDRAANLVKVTISYDGATYYATMPIILVQAINTSGNTYTMDLVENTGFRYVMYSTDGLNPLYDSSNPFALKAYKGAIDITDDNSITFTYFTLGQTYNGTTWVNENNFIAKAHGVSNPLAKNEADYRPIEKFNGLSVNNAVKCIVKDNNVEIVRAYLPIHFYLNRFGNAALNGWDGNHIEINNNGGFILAPQVGAGKKESDNSYTGIFMGNVREAGSSVDEVGLYGYYKGTRTIALDTKDGSARFGKQGAGQIVIDPASADYSGKGTARLYSNDYSITYTAPSAMVPAQTKYTAGFSYWRKISSTEYRLLREGTDYTIGNTIANTDYVWSGGAGLEIDLNDPHIRFGSGKFRVDSDGQVYATGFVTVNNLEAGDYNIPGVENWKVISATDIAQFETDADHYPPANTSEAIVCQCSYKDTIVATSGYSAVFATSAGVDIGATQTIDNISGAITQSSYNTTLTFSVAATGAITNATNTFYVKFTHTTSGLTILKAFNVNLIILGADGQQGPQGPAGPAGKDGTSVTVKGSYDTIQQLCQAHPSGNILGDGYIIGLDLYIFTNGHNTGGSDPADWNDVGQFKGEDAKRCFLVASSEVFKSTDGGSTYSPNNVTITPYTQAVSITGFAYSTNGGVSFTPLTSPYPDGIDITNNIITLNKDCELYNSTSTIAFECLTDDNDIYDIITITKVKDGINGTNGKSIVVDTTTLSYQNSTSGTTIPSGTWTSSPSPEEGKYTWTKTVTTYKLSGTSTSAGSSTSYSVAYTGPKGDQGRSLVKQTPLHYLKSNDTAPAVPTSHVTSTSTDPGVWTTAMPEYVDGYTYFACSENEFSIAPLYEWTNVVKDNGLNDALTIANQAKESVDNILDDIDNPTNEKTGKYIDIDDALSVSMIDFKMYGDTEQDTTTGKNKLYIADKASTTTNGITYSVSNGVISVSGTATAGTTIWFTSDLDKLNELSGSSATLTRVLIGGTWNFEFDIGDSSAHYYWQITRPMTNTIESQTKNTLNTLTQAPHLYIPNETSVNCKFVVQAESGSSFTSYEPYTGGVASPNPDYPQEVKTVTGRQEINIIRKNLFSGFIKGKGLNNNTGEITTRSTGAISDYIPVSFDNNNTYYLSGITGTLRNYVAAYNLNKEFLGRTGAANRFHIGLNSGSFTSGTPLATGDIKYVIVYQYEQSGSTTGSIDDVDNLQVQLEKGSTSTTYESYQSFTQEINLGKNLFDKTTVTDDKYIDTTGGEGSSTNYQASDYISIVPNTYITLSGNTQIEANYAAKLAFYDSSKTFISYQDMAIGNNTYLVPNNAKYTRFSIRDGDLDNIQLELGTQATQYSPYKEPIELCKISTYQDYIYKDNGSWYIHKEIGKHKITADDVGTFMNSLTYSKEARVSQSTIGSIVGYNGVVYSNKFKKITNTWGYDQIGVMAGAGTPITHFAFRVPVDAEKSWFTENETILYYPLATPTNTIIEDTELIEQLNKLIAQPLFENINHITDETFNVSPDLYVKYYRNTAINQNFASKDDLNNVKGTADKAYEQVQSTNVLYTTTNTINEPGASATWLDTLPSVSDKYIWQKIVYTFLDASKNYESSPACIYTPSKITNELQYCLCSQNNYDESKIENAWQSESFPWDDSYYTSTGVGNITIKRYQFVRNKYTDTNKETDNVTYSTPVLDQAWYMFGYKLAAEALERKLLSDNINNNIVTINNQDGITVSGEDSSYGIRLTSLGMQFLLENQTTHVREWTTVWDIYGNLDASKITVIDLKADNILSGTLTLNTSQDSGSFVLLDGNGNTNINGTGVTVNSSSEGTYIRLKNNTDGGGITAVSSSTEYFGTRPDTRTTTMDNAIVKNDFSFNTSVKVVHITNGIAFIGI